MNATPTATTMPVAETDPGNAVDRLLFETREREQVERRSEPRQPFFAPVSVKQIGGQQRLFSANSREISRQGIGLLHNMELERGPVILTITSAAGNKFN